MERASVLPRKTHRVIVQAGERLGEAEIKVSHAGAFKRDLKRAFGLEVWNAEKGKYEKAPGREMTAREWELFTETE